MVPTQAYQKKVNGFTLIELLVSIGIMLFLSALILVNQRAFDSTVFLSTTAYDVVTVIREARSYTTDTVGADDDASYGVYFDTSANSKFILFEDENNDETYDASEKIRAYTFNNSIVISNVDLESGPYVDCIAVTFDRPDPNPYIKDCDSSQASRSATITLESLSDTTTEKNIFISITGQTYVE